MKFVDEMDLCSLNRSTKLYHFLYPDNTFASAVAGNYSHFLKLAVYICKVKCIHTICRIWTSKV